PFCRIPLPRLHAVTIVVLKFMVIIVIAFAKRKQRHEKRVARTASRRIRLTPHGMAGRINEECAMLKHDNFRDATNEKTLPARRATHPRENQPALPDQSPPAPQANEYVDVATSRADLFSNRPRYLKAVVARA